MSGSMVDDTSRRTTSPKRRRRSSSSTARSRSSASSETVKSASRVTRKKSWRRISIPGKSSSRWRAITDSSGTNTSSPIGTKRGQHLLRHLHAREGLDAGHRVAQRNADRQRQVRDVGEGPPGPTASGVSTGKICSANSRSIVSSSSARAVRQLDHPDAVLGERRAHILLPRRASADGPSSALRSVTRSSVSRGREPVGLARVDAGVHLVVEAGHAHHEELVEVVRVDREELHPLEQRRALVLGQLQHALVELEPGDLAVHEQLRRVERRRPELLRLPPPSTSPIW